MFLVNTQVLEFELCPLHLREKRVGLNFLVCEAKAEVKRLKKMQILASGTHMTVEV